MTTLDAFCQTRALRPAFVKMDIEGFELEGLRGAAWLLREVRPTWMVEVMTGNRAAAFAVFRDARYRVQKPDGQEVRSASEMSDPNYFFVPE